MAKSILTYTNGEEKTPEITNEIRSGWNDYVTWLGNKNMRGNPELDNGGKGVELLKQYIKENPKTPLTVDIVKPIQLDFQKYRQYALDQIKAGKAAFAEGVNEENFLSELSKVDNYPGSLTTKHQFPSQYMAIYDKPSNTTTTTNLGYATSQK